MLGWRQAKSWSCTQHVLSRLPPLTPAKWMYLSWKTETGKVANAPADMNHINDACCSYLPGRHANNNDNSRNLINWKPTYYRMEKVGVHGTITEKVETFMKKWREDLNLRAKFEEYQLTFLLVSEEFESKWDERLRRTNVTKHRTELTIKKGRTVYSTRSGQDRPQGNWSEQKLLDFSHRM